MPPLYDVTDHELLKAAGNKFNALKTVEEKLAQISVAELLLGLEEPAYTGTDADKLKFAVAMQVNFQMEQGYTPQIMKSEVQNRPGVTTTFRDRYIHPGAAEIVSRVTKTAHTIFMPATFGV